MKQFSYTCRQLAEMLQAEIVGNPDIILRSINKIEDAAQGELTFLASPKFAKYLPTSKASCILVRTLPDIPQPEHRVYLLVPDPHRALLYFIHHLLDTEKPKGEGFIHPTVVLGASVQVAATAHIAAGVVIEEHSVIGDGVVIHANTVIGKNVRIGAGTVIYQNVSIYEDTLIGNNCLLHAGAVIGSDGFGYLPRTEGGYEKIPQIGNVVIEDDVEIGANSCIDRAALGSTRIGKGVKIDNLVHLAHNVGIGANTAIAAQAGIAGGTEIGERNRIAGQVGMVGYITTADDVTVGAQAGVSKSILKKGEYSGSPAVELMTRLKHEAVLRTLPQDVQALKKTIEDIVNAGGKQSQAE